MQDPIFSPSRDPVHDRYRNPYESNRLILNYANFIG